MKNDIPSKLYYSISEVSRITGVKAHVLRYWESEFPTLRVKKSRTGSRRYRKVDIEEIRAIKELLYQEGFKIAGARKMRRQARQAAIESEGSQAPQITMGFQSMDHGEQLAFVGKELGSLLQMVRELKISETPDETAPNAGQTGKKGLKKMEGTA